MKRNLVLWFLLAVVSFAYTAAEAGEDRGQSIKIVILGDTSFGESYQDRLPGKGQENVLQTRGYDYMIQEFAAFLADADFTVANLETAVTDIFPSPFEGDKKYLHYADVEKTPFYLEKYGIDFVSLANNHALDFGTRGLRQTLELLNARKIESCGAGPNSAVAKRPFVKRFDIADRQIHIAILCMFEYRKSYEEKYDYYATPDRAGINALSVAEIGSIVEKLRRNHPDLFVIAFPHWGKNYKWASKKQRLLARAIIDRGVDLVIGQGAHLIQEIERYEGRWIAYNLGNFVFGSPGRYRKMNAHPYSAIAVLLLSPDANGVAKRLRLYPIFTDNRVTNYRSRFVTEAEFEEVRTLLRTRSGSADRFDELVRSGADEYGFFLELTAQP